MHANGQSPHLTSAKPIPIPAVENDQQQLPKLRLNTINSMDRTVPASPTLQSPSMRRNVSDGNLVGQDVKEARVRVIYTGGTIGMMRNERNVLAPISNALVRSIRKYPNIHDEEYALRRFGASASMAPLVLPYVQGETRRVLYQITEYTPLLDSSNMTMHDWARIAEDIHQSYEFFDGFVVLHGTDTLSYTASALSFMLENLGKTVIITGSQIPIFETRTDGKDNFTSALIIAGNYVIPEVCVFFGNKLMRGNRTVKVSSNALDAFDSPNVPPLARIGINVNVDYRLIFRPCSVERFNVHLDLDENVGLLRIFPSISLPTFRAFLAPPIKGVVLQSFGSGNVPSNRHDLIEELRAAAARGVLIVNCTQCPTGSVAEIYDTGKVLFDLGVIPGYDMTPESALSKLAYVIGKQEWTLDVKRQMLQTNLRGELTTTAAPKMEDYDLVDAVARSLHLSSPQELDQLGATLFPAMINAAVVDGDIKKINNLKTYGADLSGVNHDNRTALHLACQLGNVKIVRQLLRNGVSVHIRDRYDRTPLLEAISIDNQEIIELLISCGAHLTGSSRAVGEQLCAAAARGSIKRLQSYQCAGADLSQPDPSGRTALHLAALHGFLEVVQYLLPFMENPQETDMLGLSALDYAKRGNHTIIVGMLNTETNTEV
ncbi:L-asparaginase [Scaptodrosophila lebanonensis]|uniref:asparaginase n=1 Tax=Drosophila lebanonensis TaxID=7225 RepID=A0A6J2U059_DROLE|nr:L-asparaginase [Scaptodrosophila lebanonensis]XP_030381288.1 L-asparaginase [Scaptodrosophila lebanonensis]XP_030381289.1 L-asparaginase [Scaptodrosophila lebanonensis]XP_030381290.1 L-asparaginase [Scaptodrosophila lebanonensis]